MFRVIDQEFPEFKLALTRHLFKYNYRKKEFLKQAFQKIEYLRDLDKKQFHHLMYILKPTFCEPGKSILRQGDETNSFIIIEHGMVELYTEFEGNEFILERLPSGSIINQRVLFMEDLMYVNIRASKAEGAHILELDKDGFEIL